MLAAIFHGLILSLGLILPLGAQNIFIFNQGASQAQFRKAIPIVITASLCDTLLILLAVLGVSVVVLSIPILQTVIFCVGLLFLLYMGWAVWHSNPVTAEQERKEISVKKQMMFAMSVSLLNPHAILDTIGVIGTSSLNYEGVEKIAFTIACICVSWIWFSSLAFVGKIIGSVGSKGTVLIIINKISAVIIWGVAVYIGIQLYQMF